MQEEAVQVRVRVTDRIQRLHTDLMIFIHKESAQKYQELLQAQNDEVAERRNELREQNKILREIQDGQKGDKDVVETRIDQLNLQITVIGSMQASTVGQMNTGFQQVLTQGQAQFVALSSQNAENLETVRAGFAENRGLHAHVLAAVQTGTGDVLGAITELRGHVDSKDARVLELLGLVLAELQAKGTAPVTEDTVRVAMAGGV